MKYPRFHSTQQVVWAAFLKRLPCSDCLACWTPPVCSSLRAHPQCLACPQHLMLCCLLLQHQPLFSTWCQSSIKRPPENLLHRQLQFPGSIGRHHKNWGLADSRPEAECSPLPGFAFSFPVTSCTTNRYGIDARLSSLQEGVIHGSL